MQVIDIKTVSNKGLPRPVAKAPDGKLRPVPWTTGNAGTFGVSVGLEQECAEKSLCLVCGEEVTEGVVFVLTPEESCEHPKPRDIYTYITLDALHILDQGPLHDKCAKLTRAHCKSVRELLSKKHVEERPYIK